MFTALFTIVGTWKQPTYPLTNEWIKKLCVCMYIYVCVYIYNGILLGHKKERICVSSNEVDERRAYYVE